MLGVKAEQSQWATLVLNISVGSTGGGLVSIVLLLPSRGFVCFKTN